MESTGIFNIRHETTTPLLSSRMVSRNIAVAERDTDRQIRKCGNEITVSTHMHRKIHLGETRTQRNEIGTFNEKWQRICSSGTVGENQSHCVPLPQICKIFNTSPRSTRRQLYLSCL